MARILKLNKKAEIEIRPKAPFNFDGTVFKPDHFPTPDHIWEKRKYWQIMRVNGKILGFKLENRGIIKNPKVRISLYAKNSLTENDKNKALEKIDWQFGFSEDLSEFYKEFKNDKFLAPLFKKYLGMRVNSGEVGFYPMLQVYIVLQNATVRRTVQMMKNLLERYGQKVKFDGKEMYVFLDSENFKQSVRKRAEGFKIGLSNKIFKENCKRFC